MYIYTAGHSSVRGTGIYLPEERVTGQSLMQAVDTKNRFDVSYDWLERVTGIKEKRVAPPGMLPSDMATAAAREAMERAKITARQVDAIIYTGLTRDHLEPATAHVVQAKLGARNAAVFDISNACHGFMNGMHVMDALIATGQVTCGLVVTGEQGSVFTQKALDILTTTTDRSLFNCWAPALTVGDAGAAIIMSPKVAPEAGLVGLMLQSQGQHAKLCTAADPWTKGPWFADMTAIVAEAGKLIHAMFNEFMYKRLKWRVQDLSKCLIHQIGHGAFQIHKRLGVPPAIMPRTVDLLGNLITASIPVSLHYCIINQELRPGSKIYLSGQGSGISLSQAGVVWDDV